MARREANRIVHYIRKLVPEADLIGHGDGSLLDRFVRLRDALAFAEILRRHGPMVWGVCRRLLDCPHAAEDAFQATFLVLIKKSGDIARRDKLANWQYGVACRTAARARVEAARRRRHERSTPGRPMAKPVEEVMWRDLRPVLDEEVQRLPERYRTPFVLCYLEGLTNKQAADQLGCPEGTVVSRLAWARHRLRTRLSRRGVALSVSLLAMLFSETESMAAVPMALADATMRVATLYSSGQAGVVAITPSAVILMEGVLHSMLFARIKLYAIAFLVLAFLGSMAGIFSYRTLAAERQAPNADQAAAPAAAPATNDLPAADPVRMQLTRMQLEAAQKELVQVQSDLRKAQVEMTLARNKERNNSKRRFQP
jgi:RNA polymerase sigma factor (sigma-70 family)